MTMLLPKAENLRRIILANASAIQKKVPWADAAALLGALAEVESSFGANAVPRYEKAFDVGGRWENKALTREYGAWAACSYGSWQIMYSVAVELGFDPARSPAELWNDDIGIHWVIEYINRRILDRGVQTIREFSISYNGGSKGAVNEMTTNYANKFDLAYAGVVARRNLKNEVLSA